MNTMEYQYDALHRIRYAQSSTFDGAGFTPNNQYNTSYTYDGNGNIQNLIRNGNGGILHNLSYQYADTEGPNRLSSVNGGAFGGYTYDKIGNLLTDSYDNIDVEWTVYGKVREVTTANGPDLVYLYDAGGNRLAKIRSDGEMDFYIRDASGNVMSVYEKTLGAQYEAYAQKEVHLYGSSRLGIRKYDDRNIEINGPVSDDFSAPTYMRTRGQKLFEFSNHLGNTLVTLTDQKLGADASTDGRSDYYAAVDVSTSDYYPFGLAMGARTVSSSAYRYGFNGKENDTEWGERMIQDYGFRLYNPTIAKFLSVDPLAKSYPWYTPYQFAGNMPIIAIDLDGAEPKIQNTFKENGKSPILNKAIRQNYAFTLAYDAYHTSGAAKNRKSITALHVGQESPRVTALEIMWNRINYFNNSVLGGTKGQNEILYEEAINMYFTVERLGFNCESCLDDTYRRFVMAGGDGDASELIRGGIIEEMTIKSNGSGNTAFMYADVAGGQGSNSKTSTRKLDIKGGSGYNKSASLSDYTPSDNTVFSGVVNVKTKKLINFQSSGTTVNAKGETPFGIVEKNGGHSTVLKRSGGSFKDNVAVTIFYAKKGNLRLEFKSTSVTKQFNRANKLGRKSEPTEEHKALIIEAVQDAFPTMKITY